MTTTTPTVRCMYGNAPENDCCARACPLHGTPSASPYGARRGAVIPAVTDETIAQDKAASAFFSSAVYRTDYRYA